MKIRRIRLNKLRNEEWFNFFKEFKAFVEEFFPQTQDIEELFTVFLTLYAMSNSALDKIIKSGLSSVIVQLDEERDSRLRGMTAAVRSGLYHYDAGKCAAAEKIAEVLDHYGDIALRSYNEETAAIYSLLQDLRGPYADAVQTLELNGWIDELDNSNQNFEKAILDRHREILGKTDVNMLDVRRKTDRCYLDIVERIEALMLIHGDGEFAPFVTVLNNNIDRYITVLNRRSGNKKNEDTDLATDEN
ncbi:MAG: DUF6261 family protein [Prevotellaceae bacterium]|jgi:hypothetical protein|nr:DUF6261 family protein [Prevotellaceae bacterium]